MNSIRQRLPRLLALLERHAPDVVCLQELKVTDEDFPAAELAAAGYQSTAFGQRAYNGVAILARGAIDDVARGFAEDPVPMESRVLSATVGGVRVVCCYVVNGKEIGDPAYEVKLAWLDGLADWLGSFDMATPLVVAGDFNIAPDDRDVYDPKIWSGRNLVSEPERERLGKILSLGLTDLGRQAAGDVVGPFSYWDYRAGAFHRGWGLRIDLALGTAPVSASLREVSVDREERKASTGEGKPSDHAPVIVEF